MAGKSKNSMTITWDTKDLLDNLARANEEFADRLGDVTKRFTFVTQDAARNNAPWTDRTANARKGLFAKSFTSSNQFEIVLYHTMYYGIFLERRWGGKWGIIPDTVSRVSKVYTAAMTKEISDIMRGSR